jgi:aminoglycoside phosphotransferase (APT) family kinase protein
MNREQPTYIRHMDDHVGQFLVDRNGRLNAVIDWEL